MQAAWLSLLAGCRFEEFDALEIALQSEIAVVELERAADPVFVKFEGERIGGRPLAGSPARIEIAYRHRITLDRNEGCCAPRLFQTLGLARDRAADHRQRLVDFLAVGRAVIHLGFEKMPARLSGIE